MICKIQLFTEKTHLPAGITNIGESTVAGSRVSLRESLKRGYRSASFGVLLISSVRQKLAILTVEECYIYRSSFARWFSFCVTELLHSQRCQRTIELVLLERKWVRKTDERRRNLENL